MNRRQLTDSRKNSAELSTRDFGVGPANGSNVQTVSVPAVPLGTNVSLFSLCDLVVIDASGNVGHHDWSPVLELRGVHCRLLIVRQVCLTNEQFSTFTFCILCTCVKILHLKPILLGRPCAKLARQFEL